MCKLKFDGVYVKESDYEYLVECEPEESIFTTQYAEYIKKQCPERVEIEETV